MREEAGAGQRDRALLPEVARLLEQLAAVHRSSLTVMQDGHWVASFGTADAGGSAAVAHARLLPAAIHLVVPGDAAVSAPALAEHVAQLVDQVHGLRSDVDLLTEELLERYEEVTLLHEVSSDLGVVVDVRGAAQAALARALKVIPAGLGEVLLGGAESGDLVEVASVRTIDHGDANHAVAHAVAHVSLDRRAQVLVHAGQEVPGTGLVTAEPVLAVPLRFEGTGSDEGAPPGALVLVGHELEPRFSAGEAQLAATLARQLALGIENGRLVSVLRGKERLERELELAAGIQLQLLPAAAPPVAGARARGVCLPAEQVGGDYYDFVMTDDGALTVVVADVTGHGVGPALIMAMTRSVLRAQFASTSSLTQALTATNTTMWDDLLATGLFITVFCVGFDPTSRRLTFVNGGHHPALLRRPDGRVESLDSDGLPIGLLDDPSYEQGEAVLEPGSVLLVFTDGVVENRAPDGSLFGTPRLVEFLTEHGEQPDLIERLLAELEEHRAGAPRQDDITIVELRCDGSGASALEAS